MLSSRNSVVWDIGSSEKGMLSLSRKIDLVQYFFCLRSLDVLTLYLNDNGKAYNFRFNSKTYFLYLKMSFQVSYSSKF